MSAAAVTMTESVSAILAKTKNQPGPKPELFKAEGDWKELVDRTLAKKRPVGGWPKV